MDGSIATPEREPSRIFDRISVLSDPIRCRILLLLEGQELAVSEICQVLQLPQSTVSRHLKTLVDDGWIRARKEGTSRQYSATPEPEDVSAQRLWQLVREEISSSVGALQDRTRLTGILSERRTRSQEFFSTAAGDWAELRQDLFGERFDLEGLLGLLDEEWTVGDLGCGTGQTTQSLAPFVSGIVAIDESDAMLAAARTRLAGTHNVDLRLGRLEDLPIDDHTLDAAISVMVLHHVTDPARVLIEASRALKPSGKLLVVDMLPHERQEFRQQMGHVWLGFDEPQIRLWLDNAGFHRIRFHELRADPNALGPSLFAATARVAS